MPSIRTLRENLQAPRQPYDTFYGRHVMRFFSIYLTAFFSKISVSPSAITALSILVGLAGAFLIANGQLLAGVLCVNGWYLLDHVDGELARFYKTSSPTGLYFDTIANALILPATFVALGCYCARTADFPQMFYAGLVAGYGALMLLILAYCESAVLMQCLAKKSDWNVRSKGDFQKKSGQSAAGRIFGALHTLASFPQFLLLFTGMLFILKIFCSAWIPMGTAYLLLGYAALLTFVWIVVLGHTILSQKLNKKLTEF